ncbi:hypothetical protein BDF22DRAFT_742143 [Syncephalis plumigaleata]|nr:hypothetical protein BDF22DRAFT_742143 [Syncephalis plumigaleata]
MSSPPSSSFPSSTSAPVSSTTPTGRSARSTRSLAAIRPASPPPSANQSSSYPSTLTATTPRSLRARISTLTPVSIATEERARKRFRYSTRSLYRTQLDNFSPTSLIRRKMAANSEAIHDMEVETEMDTETLLVTSRAAATATDSNVQISSIVTEQTLTEANNMVSSEDEDLFHDAHEYSFEMAPESHDEYEETETFNSNDIVTNEHDIDTSSDTMDTALDQEDEDDDDEEDEEEEEEDEEEEEEEEEEDEEDEAIEEQEMPDSLRAFVEHDPVARQRVQAMLNGIGPRIKSIMRQLRQRTDPSLHLIGLQELSELLLVSTEDMLTGVLSLDRLAQELVFHLKGEDPVCGGNPEIMLLACRCIANLMEVIPSSTSTLVCHEVIPILCAKLQAIEYIDLAEQALSTLVPISAEYPGYILRDNGILSVLMFIDFFTVNAQRTALTITANSCRAARAEQWDTINELLPTLERLLDYSDQRIMETVCLCFSRLVNGFMRHQDHLEHMMTTQVLRRFDDILRSTSTIKSSDRIQNHLLWMLCVIARVSPKLAVEVLKLNTIELIYQWLTGRMPPENNEEAVIPLSSMVTEAVSRTGDRLKNALGLLSELLPPVSIDSPSQSTTTNEAEIEATKSKREILDEYLSSDDRQRIVQWMLPVLVEVYTITIKVDIREKILAILLQLVEMITSTEQLHSLLKNVPVANVVASTLNDANLSLLSMFTIQLAYSLLLKLPNPYAILFDRESIRPMVEKLKDTADEEVKKLESKYKRESTKASDKDETSQMEEEEEEEDEETDDETSNDNEATTSSDVNETATLTNIRELLRERLLRQLNGRVSGLFDGNYRSSHNYAILILHKSCKLLELMDEQKAISSNDVEQRANLQRELQQLAKQLKSFDNQALESLSTIFETSLSLVSSMELVQSGIIESLIHYLVDESMSDAPSLEERHLHWISLFHQNNIVSVMESKMNGATSLAMLVKRLQEALSRHDALKVLNDYYGPFDDRSNVLGRQIRLRLMPADDVGVPKAYSNLVVSIHAAVPFQVLDDYLAPRLLEKMTKEHQVPVDRESDIDAIINDEQDNEDNEDDEDNEDNEDEGLSDQSDSIRLFDGNGGRIRRQSISSSLTSPTRAVTTEDTSQAMASTSSSSSSSSSTWKLDYQVEGHAVKLTDTIYSAIYPVISDSAMSSPWSHVYTVKYSKVLRNSHDEHDEEKKAQLKEEDKAESIAEPCLPILNLLDILYQINKRVEQGFYTKTEFINNQWTAKLRRQLEQPLVTISQLIPAEWLQLAEKYPFLFPLDTRQLLWKLGSFGYARALDYWLRKTGSTRDHSSGREQLLIGNIMKKHRARLARDHLLELALDLFASDQMSKKSEAMLEVEYVDEVGTGLGPTLEFYAQISKELQATRLGLWRSELANTLVNADGTLEDHYSNASSWGLFPKPVLPSNDSSMIRKYFWFMGRWIAQALMDNRLLDIPLSPIFIQKVLGRPIANHIHTLKQIDPAMAQSLQLLYGYIDQKRDLYRRDQNEETQAEFKALQQTVQQLGLDFTLPGYPSIELKNDGQEIDVTIYNLEEYIQLVLDWTLNKGIEEQATAFQEGFDSKFPIKSLLCFESDELLPLLSAAVEEWHLEVIIESIKTDHGYTTESMAVLHLAEIMCELDTNEQRLFLQFITGSPRLPVGGFKRLYPPLTVVRKLPESPLISDDYLPSVMTCVNYLKLPDYSSKELMKKRLFQAIKEGQGSFHMS